MGWLGKIIGGTIGFTLGGPLGAIAGAALGHGFDASDGNLISDSNRTVLSKDENAQLIFFTAAKWTIISISLERIFNVSKSRTSTL